MCPCRARWRSPEVLFGVFSVCAALLTHPATAWCQAADKDKDEKKPPRAVTFTFTGKVAQMSDRGGVLDGSVQVGSSLAGTYTFDPETPDSNKDSTVGDYQHTVAGYGLLVKVGNYEFKTDPARVNFLLEVVDRPERDNYLLRSYNNVSSGPRLPADAISHISWQLDDPTGKVLAGDAIPAGPPAPAAWQSDFGLTLDGLDDRKGRRGELFIRGHVDFIFWDLPPPGQLERPKQKKPTDKELEATWADLAGDDVARGYRAAQALLAGPEEALPFLRQRLKPQPVDARRMARLLSDLDSDAFAEREKATRELEALGESAEAELRQALAAEPSAEARRRLENLLQKLEGAPPSRERLRALRALKVLEHLGSPEGLQALQELAKHEPKGWLAREARAAAERVSSRQANKP
jgi:hypothetical protein